MRSFEHDLCSGELQLTMVQIANHDFKLVCDEWFGQTGGGAIRVSPCGSVIGVAGSDGNDREILMTGVERTQQGHAMTAVIEVDHREIDRVAVSTDGLKGIAGSPRNYHNGTPSFQ
ncbi:MAG: hypothetical protein ABI579_09005 [Candidatus Sumerlaeota bacterium]